VSRPGRLSARSRTSAMGRRDSGEQPAPGVGSARTVPDGVDESGESLGIAVRRRKSAQISVTSKLPDGPGHLCSNRLPSQSTPRASSARVADTGY
jgi:hypothetical protein